ncbi:MAG: signal peptide peptidase SppA [Dehalococcoidia bacterium]|nr:signal peptide peptidase SppA [Dehalococcoidia bacterium]
MKRFKAIVFLTALLVLFALSASCTLAQNKVAVISLSGPIESESSSFFFGGSAITPDSVRTELERAKNDDSVKAIVLQINSPGGSVAASQEIVNLLEQVEKPIVVSMSDLAASGGYYISAGTDKIIALPGTLTGSIGVISEVPNLKGLFDKLGIDMQVFIAGKHKDMYAGFRDLTPEEKVIMQDMTDQLYNQFVQVVAKGRNLSEDKVRELATGQLYTGIQAKELGLVDELGGLQTAIDAAASLAGISTPEVEYYRPQTPSILDSLLGMGWQKLSNLIQPASLNAEDIILLETLTNPYPQPEYR